MSHLQAAMIRSIQGFATELTRAPLYDCGHADAWELVERAGTTEDLSARARVLRRLRRLCTHRLRVALPGLAHRGHPVRGREDVRGRRAHPRAHRPGRLRRHLPRRAAVGCSQRTPVSSLPQATARISAAFPRGAACRSPRSRTSWLTSHDPRKPAEEQYFGGPSLGEDLHASVRCRSPLEGRIGIPHHAVQVREVGCRHGKDLSALVHSPPKKFGLPRGRCDVESPGIAVAADEQNRVQGSSASSRRA